MQKQQLSFILILLLFTLTNCGKKEYKVVELTTVPLQQASFDVHEIDSTKVLNPSNIFYFKEHIILMEYNNTPFFSFWTLDSLSYDFSDGYIGGGPNELINPSINYFTKSDSSFYILDSQVEREIKIDGKNIKILSNTPLIFPDAINQLVHVGQGTYIMAGKTDGSDNAEHTLYTPTETRVFGDYPSKGIDKNIDQFKLDYKLTAGILGGSTIWDFYLYHNLIRQYSTEGKLLQELRLNMDEGNKNYASMLGTEDLTYYWTKVIAEKESIYVLFSGKKEDSSSIPELQIWNWDGGLKSRYLFDKPFDTFAVSDSGILYAFDTESPYQIYTYDFNR